jgi:diaminopropionate ammonia-lyase
MAIDDDWAHEAMRMFAKPSDGDAAIEAGSSGSATLGGLLALVREPSLAAAKGQLSLTGESHVLLVVSEGVTDPAIWASHVRTVSGPAGGTFQR